eukprot:352312-Chlamydomonas_euryale.AAC.28
MLSLAASTAGVYTCSSASATRRRTADERSAAITSHTRSCRWRVSTRLETLRGWRWGLGSGWGGPGVKHQRAASGGVHQVRSCGQALRAWVVCIEPRSRGRRGDGAASRHMQRRHSAPVVGAGAYGCSSLRFGGSGRAEPRKTQVSDVWRRRPAGIGRWCLALLGIHEPRCHGCVRDWAPAAAGRVMGSRWSGALRRFKVSGGVGATEGLEVLQSVWRCRGNRGSGGFRGSRGPRAFRRFKVSGGVGATEGPEVSAAADGLELSGAQSVWRCRGKSGSRGVRGSRGSRAFRRFKVSTKVS